MLDDGWKSGGRVFVLALILDFVYQIVTTRFVQPGEAISTAFLLAIVSYVFMRRLVLRLARKK